MELELNLQIIRVDELQKHIKFPLLSLPVRKPGLATLTQSHILQYVIQTQSARHASLTNRLRTFSCGRATPPDITLSTYPKSHLWTLSRLDKFQVFSNLLLHLWIFNSEFSIQAMKPQTLSRWISNVTFERAPRNLTSTLKFTCQFEF